MERDAITQGVHYTSMGIVKRSGMVEMVEEEGKVVFTVPTK